MATPPSPDVTRTRPAPLRVRLGAFYRATFLPEHQHPANVALHVIAALGSAAFALLALASHWPWLALLYPVVHAAPGLLGHRLFERKPAVGDVRLGRTDHPLWWFIVANHRLTWDVLSGKWRRDPSRRSCV